MCYVCVSARFVASMAAKYWQHLATNKCVFTISQAAPTNKACNFMIFHWDSCNNPPGTSQNRCCSNLIGCVIFLPKIFLKIFTYLSYFNRKRGAETVALGDFHGILRIADGSPQCWQLLNDAVSRPFALAAAAVAPVKPFAPAAILGHLRGMEKGFHGWDLTSKIQETS